MIEVNMLISILKLTKKGPVSHETVKNDMRLPKELVDGLMRRLQKDGLIYVRDNMLEASGIQRLQVALRALRMGADVERVSNLLHWKEFEAITAVAFEDNGYEVTKNLHFKHAGRRYEIDVVGCKKPLVVCADCKHWRHKIGRSALETIVKEQIGRARALAESLPSPKIKIESTAWISVKFLPMILSLVIDESKFCAGVPVVPILQLQDFLHQLPAHTDKLFCISSRNLAKSSTRHRSLLY